MGARRRAFTLLEVVIALVVGLLLVYTLVQLGHHFLVGFISGEQKYSELREAGIVLDGLRGDVEGFQPDLSRDDLGLNATPATLTFTRLINGAPVLISYQYVAAQGMVKRQAGSEAPVFLGGGLVRSCSFATGAYARNAAGGLVACAPRQSAGALRRVFITLGLSVAPAQPGSEDPWLTFKTNLFPCWANRRLTSVWNRKK